MNELEIVRMNLLAMLASAAPGFASDGGGL
jgi:hypothetical protein